MPTIILPSHLALKANCNETLTIEGSTLAQALENVVETHPGLRNKIYAKPGVPNRFLRIFVDGRQTNEIFSGVPIQSGTCIKILMALAGG